MRKINEQLQKLQQLADQYKGLQDAAEEILEGNWKTDSADHQSL